MSNWTLRSSYGSAVGFWAVLILVFLAGVQASAQVEPLGGQFQVNTYTTDNQRQPRVAMAQSGEFLVVWRSDGSAGSDSSFSSIQARFFDSAGVPILDDFQLNTYTTSFQSRPEVTALPDGGFIGVWSGAQARGQRVDSAGVPVGDEFIVSDGVVPAIASAADGSFVVVWQTGSPNDIEGQRYDSAGDPIGGSFVVNTLTLIDEFSPRVAVRSDGRFVVAWNSQASAGTDQDASVQARVFSSDGGALGDQFQVNTYTTDFQFWPRIAFVESGGFLVSWESRGSFGSDTSLSSIQARAFAEDGSPLGVEFQVNSVTAGSQSDPYVAVLPNDDLVVVWHSSAGTRGRLVETLQGPLGDEFQVGEVTVGVNYPASVAADEAGRFVVSWGGTASLQNDSSGYSIQARRFRALEIFSDGFESSDTSSWDVVVD